MTADDAATFDEALALCRSGRLGDARRIFEDFARVIKQRIVARSGVLFEDFRVVTEFERFFLSALREAKPEVAWRARPPLER